MSLGPSRSVAAMMSSADDAEPLEILRLLGEFNAIYICLNGKVKKSQVKFPPNTNLRNI